MPDTSLSASKPRAARADDTVTESADLTNHPPDASRDAWPARNAPREYGGRKGPDPVRYGDWEKNGRCIDF